MVKNVKYKRDTCIFFIHIKKIKYFAKYSVFCCIFKEIQEYIYKVKKTNSLFHKKIGG